MNTIMNVSSADCPTSKVTAQMHALAKFIEEHADEQLPLSRLSKEVGLSTFYLQRNFKAIFGVSPKEYQNATRLKKLKSSLKKGQEITEAIYEAGFGSTSRIYEQIDKRVGMTLSAYRAGGKGEEISYAIRNTAIGYVIMAATDRGVCFVHFDDDPAKLEIALKQEFPQAKLIKSAAENAETLNRWMDALNEYISNGGPKPNIPLLQDGTAFQMRVWRFLMSVKEGEMVSLREIANKVGSPKGIGAVKRACAANNLAVLIPCHRILRSNGTLANYRWGLERKKVLLELERKKRQKAHG